MKRNGSHVTAPRVALFADSFHEINGVGLTCRTLDDFARRRGYPMLSVHVGPANSLSVNGSVVTCELQNSRIGFGLEADLRFDLLAFRHLGRVRAAFRQFNPDVVHITGPNSISLLGAKLSHEFKVPLLASWHTNVHEYASRRLGGICGDAAGRWVEEAVLGIVLRYYSLARATLAPNRELIQILEAGAGKPCGLMRRGVDCHLYDPARRTRNDSTIVVGYVGRLSPEKSIRRLKDVEEALERAGVADFRIELAGHGGEREWLKANITRLRDHGVLQGIPLAAAYANFDIFVFPSETDTYGNVVQEAMASGVPCVVTRKGGPAAIVTDGADGFVRGRDDFANAVVQLATDRALRETMARAARVTALKASWDAVFESVYRTYAEVASGTAETRDAPVTGPG
ncbi:MAG: glycosyltransferase [Bryobacterales bacterium]|nr:glycosyltransferase [Bryobacterales bacterium]